MTEDPQLRSRPSLWDRTIGLFLIFVGVAGMLLPIMPGVPFFIVGLVKLFGPDHWITRPVLGKLKEAAHHVREWNEKRKAGSSRPSDPGNSAQGSPADS